MTAVLECAFQANNVFLVLRIGILQLVQNLHLLQPCFVPVYDEGQIDVLS